MKRSRAFIDGLSSEAPASKKVRFSPATPVHDDLDDLEAAMAALDDESIPATPKAASSSSSSSARPPKASKKGRPVNNACVEMLPGESLADAGTRHAEAMKEKVMQANGDSLGYVYPFVMPADAMETYRQKKLAAFSVTITLPIKVASQFSGPALYANAAVMNAYKQVCDIFQVTMLEGRSTSDSKKQYRAFLKKVDGNPQFRRVEMKGKHVYDCIRKTKFYPAMEVQPGAQSLLHVQGHLEVYYFYDGFFLHADPQELTRVLESMGYEWARVHIVYKTTEVYDSKQYTRIPEEKKNKTYWEKKSAWMDAAPVKLSKGTFSKSVYLSDTPE